MPTRHNLGIALASANRLQEAVAQFQEAVRIRPSDASFHQNLGAALGDEDRAAEAGRSSRPPRKSGPVGKRQPAEVESPNPGPQQAGGLTPVGRLSRKRVRPRA